MSPILQGLTGLVFLMTAETGVILSNYARNTSREMLWVNDASVGYDIGFCAHNPEAGYTFTGKLSSLVAGLGIAAPATALTIANTKFGNGVGTDGTNCGTVWTLTVGRSHAEKGFLETNISAMQKPGIT